MYGVAPWVNSAYGKNARNIGAYLKEAYDVEMAVYYGLQGSSLNYNGIMVHACPGTQGKSDEWAEYWYMMRNMADSWEPRRLFPTNLSYFSSSSLGTLSKEAEYG